MSQGGFGSRARKSGPDGKPNYEPPYPILAQGQVRFVGDPVAIVVAATLDQAKSAAELIEVDYQPEPAVTSIADALKPGAPVLWEACPDNLCVLTELGDRKRTDEAFARASHVATVDLVITRVAAAPILESLLGGIRFVMQERVILAAMSLDLFSVFLAGSEALLPVFADEILHVGAQGLGVLRAAPAAGAPRGHRERAPRRRRPSPPRGWWPPRTAPPGPSGRRCAARSGRRGRSRPCPSRTRRARARRYWAITSA